MYLVTVWVQCLKYMVYFVIKKDMNVVKTKILKNPQWKEVTLLQVTKLNCLNLPCYVEYLLNLQQQKKTWTKSHGLVVFVAVQWRLAHCWKKTKKMKTLPKHKFKLSSNGKYTMCFVCNFRCWYKWALSYHFKNVLSTPAALHETYLFSRLRS